MIPFIIGVMALHILREEFAIEISGGMTIVKMSLLKMTVGITIYKR